MHCCSDPDLLVSGHKSTSSEALSEIQHRSTDSGSTKRIYVRGGNTTQTRKAKSVRAQCSSTSAPMGRVKVQPLPKLIKLSVLLQVHEIFLFCFHVAAIHIATSIGNSDCALHSSFCAWNSRGSKRHVCTPQCIAHISTYSRLRRVRYTACSSQFHLYGMVRHDRCCSPPRRRHLPVGRGDSGTICLSDS